MSHAVFMLIAAALAILAARVAILLIAPVGKCPRCKGQRVAAHWLTRKSGTCPRCKGHGRSYRRGASIVHKLLWEIRGANPEGKED